MVDINDICGHSEPVWQGEADSLVMCDLSDSGLPGKWEQLWAKRSGGHEFVICCIPFFAREISLGDKVSVKPSGGFEWVIDSVVGDSGNTVYHVIFEEDAAEYDTTERQGELIRNLNALRLEYEVFQLGYVAINCPMQSSECEELERVLNAYSLLEWSQFENTKRNA
ncbi:DUF4265 domain-containing protein [Streptomyces sp. NPDC059679]|uniref:DUF4265 domain-containing protein n=1 Tax=Streptomyces sp. NPDC059679 TaxID=3346903 RepID=UPI0036AE320F